jgi:hypothetical protein
MYDKPLLSVAMARGIAGTSCPRKGVDARRLNVKLLANTAAVRITPAPAASCAPGAPCATQHLVLAVASKRALPLFPPALCWHQYT